MSQEPAGNHRFKAVCYKCKYKTLSPPTNRSCPQCSFPLILQPLNQSVRLNVREIFDRTSVEVGPRLPGLGNDARAPLAAAPMAAGPMGPGMAMTMPEQILAMEEQARAARRSRIQRISMTLAFVSAIVLGVAAAVVQSAL